MLKFKLKNFCMTTLVMVRTNKWILMIAVGKLSVDTRDHKSRRWFRTNIVSDI